MKHFVFTLFFSGLASYVLAQSQPFDINGKIEGDKSIKNALFYDSEYKLLKKVEIVDKSFHFKGEYHQIDRRGQWPICNLVLTDKDSVDGETIRLEGRKIFYEASVNVIYDIDKQRFIVNGDNENELYNRFLSNRENYTKQLKAIYPDAGQYRIPNANERATKARLVKEMQEKDLAIIHENPNSVAAMHSFLAFPLMGMISFNEANAIFMTFPETMRSSGYGKGIADRVNRLKDKTKINYPGLPKLALNQTMFDFTLDDLEGISVNGKEVYGTYTLIDFWASWCVPCRAETPNLRAALESYRNDGFKIIAISIDDEKNEEKWKAIVKIDKMQNFINLHNPNASSGLGKELNITAIPANYLVDRNGKVVAINLRGSELEDVLKDLYKK